MPTTRRPRVSPVNVTTRPPTPKGSIIATSASPSAPGVRLFAAVIGLTSLAILAEAVLAGAFLGKRTGRHTLVDSHGMLANLTVLLAVISVVAAWRLAKLRRGPLLVGSIVLLVLIVIQTVVGHIISDGHHPGWIVVHVPVAMLVFGLTVWLSVQAAVISRAERLA
jgi:hypothetical protein